MKLQAVKTVILIGLMFSLSNTNSQSVRLIDTTYFSSTITDSASGWTRYVLPVGGIYELINFGADTIFYKIGTDEPSVAVNGIELPPLTTTGLISLYKNATIYFRERANTIFSKFTIKGQ